MAENDWKSRLGVVFSTNPDFKYETEEESPQQQTLPPQKQKLRVFIEKKNRGGKQVTVIAGFIGTEEDLQALGRMLKTKCGTGGSVKDGEIKLRRIGEFIPVTLNARKADDSTNVYYRLTDNTMALERFTKNGHLLNSWKLFPDIPMTNFSIMSFGLALSDDGTKAAIAMTAFPCLNILDMVTGERKSVTFARRIGFESVYDTYRSSFTYPEISSCCGIFTFGGLVCVRTDNVGYSNGDAKSALLIFDWDGNLKYRLLISEDLATYGTVFDPVHKKMYCCTNNDTLYCYDLSKYL